MSIYFDEFLVIAIAHFIALLSPGADFVYLVNCSISNSKKVAMGASLGIALSNGFYILLCLLGYATLISQSKTLTIAIKLLGGGYLIYLGVGILTSKHTPLKTKNVKPNNSFYKEVAKGFYLSFLNPKISIFYISLFALVISKHTPFYIQMLYGVWMFLFVFVWDSFLVILINKQGVRDKILSISKINAILGVLLMGMGVLLFYSLMQS